MAGPKAPAPGQRLDTSRSSSSDPGVNAMSALATTSHGAPAPAAPRLAALPYPRLRPVRSNRTSSRSATAAVPASSSGELSTTTTSYGCTVALVRESMNGPSTSPEW